MPHYIVSLLKSYRREKKKRAKDYTGATERRDKFASDFTEVTIDASFRDKTQNKPGDDNIVRTKAGAAAVITNRRGIRSILINNLDHEKVGTSHEAEVINAIVTLESLPRGHVRSLVCDASSLSNPMEMILREGRSADTGLNGHHNRLVDAMARHPELTVRRMNRNRGNIPLADAFAKCAAHGDVLRLKEQIEFRLPVCPEVIFTGPAKDTLQQRFAQGPLPPPNALEIAPGVEGIENLDGMAPA